MSKTIYPLRNRFIPGVPAAVTTASAREAAGLIASGAFTDDPAHPDRDHAAPDLSVDAVAEQPVAPKLEPAGQADPEPEPTEPAAA